MNDLTSDQYRLMAEGLLREALTAPEQKKQKFLQDAARYLAFARAQDDRSFGTPLQNAQNETEDRHRQIRQLIKQALELPTAEIFATFLDFTTTFRRLGVWNARMAYIQRPGARVIASEYEWKKIGRSVLPDAVPIIILWPSSPIRLVYELEDTGPKIDRKSIKDPFAVAGNFDRRILCALDRSLARQNSFKINIEDRRQGFAQAGSAAAHGTTTGPPPLSEAGRIGEFAQKNGTSNYDSTHDGIPAFRVTVNDRLEEKARFVTIVHELGHIFLGHLGPCSGRRGGSDEESGWPDRRHLGKNEREVEAEAVAYQVASRAGIVPASAQYIKGYAERANMAHIDVDLIVRSAARIERMCKIRYGSIEFKAPS